MACLVLLDETLRLARGDRVVVKLDERRIKTKVTGTKGYETNF